MMGQASMARWVGGRLLGAVALCVVLLGGLMWVMQPPPLHAVPLTAPCGAGCASESRGIGTSHMLYFNGMDDWVTLSATLPITQTWTLSAWIYPSEPITLAQDSTGQGGYPLTLNQWSHIALVQQDSLTTLLVNANAVYTTTAPHTLEQSLLALRIRLPTYPEPLPDGPDMEMDEVRLWQIAQERADIYADMFRYLTGQEAGLLWYSRFNDGAGQLLEDVTGRYVSYRGLSPQPDLADPTWVESHDAHGDFPDAALMVLAFDNDLAPHAAQVIERLRPSTVDSTVRYTLLVDEAEDGDTRIVEVANGRVTDTQTIPWLPPEVRELDTASAETLRDFLRWGRRHYPSWYTSVVLLGHGVGPVPTLAYRPTDEATPPPLPPLPQERDLTPFDVTDGSFLSTPELGEALAQASDGGLNPFSVVFFDQCFGGSLDMLYEVRQSADIFIASPNYAWASFAYDSYYNTMRASPTITNTERAVQLLIETYQAFLDDSHPNAIFWVSDDTLDELGTLVSALGDTLSAARLTDEALILDAALHSQFADTTLGSNDLTLQAPDELIGLGSFATNLRTRFPVGSPVHTIAGDILLTLEQVHTAARVGQPWINPEVTWHYTDSLTILAPLTPTLPATTIWRASLYTQTAPLPIHWMPDPTQVVSLTVPLAYTREGRWDDFIAAWYHQPLTPTVASIVASFPPPLVLTETTPITLTIQSGLGHSLLTWQHTSTPEPADFSIYVQEAGKASWEVAAIVPASARSFQHTTRTSGRYHYRVIARAASGTILSVSPPTPSIVGILEVSPATLPNDRETPLRITAIGLAEPITVTLGGYPLPVTQFQPPYLTAMVPAGLPAGVYALRLQMANEQTVAYRSVKVQHVAPPRHLYLPLLRR